METNLARLAEAAHERLGDYPSLFFEGTWHTSGELHDRAEPRRRRADATSASAPATGSWSSWPTAPRSPSSTTRSGGPARSSRRSSSSSPPPELQHILADSGAVAVVTTPELLPKVQRGDRRPELPVIVVGDGGTVSVAELESADPASIVDRYRRRPGRAAVHRRHDRAQQGRRAQPRQPDRTPAASSRGSSHMPGSQRGHHRRCRCRTRSACWSPSAPSTLPSRRCRVLQRWFEPASFLAPRRRAPGAGDAGRAVDARDAARPAARGRTT